MANVTVCLLLIYFVSSVPEALGYHFLCLHSFSAASHVLPVYAVTKELISKGHRVTTVYFSEKGVEVKPAGKNHTVIKMHIDNELGKIPCLTKEKKSVLEYASYFDLWEKGLTFGKSFDVYNS